MSSELRWKAHPAQAQLLQDNARFIVAPLGRRAGKSEAAMAWLLMQGRQLIDQGHDPEAIDLLWAGPQWTHCEVGLNKLRKPTREDGTRNPLYAAHKESKGSPGYMEADTTFGFTIDFSTTKNHERIEGRGLHGIVVDEAGLVSEDAWYNSIYPTLGMSDGRAFITGKPNGRNWYYDVYQKGRDPEYPQYSSHQHPSSVNPHLPESFVEEARRDLPNDVYRQEILAEFLEDSGEVFQNIRSLVTTSDDYRGPENSQGWGLQDPSEVPDDVRCVAGWDPAKRQDYSVFTVLRLPERHVVCFERTSEEDYVSQVETIAEKLRAYNNADLWIDSNGVGDAVVDMAQRLCPGMVEGKEFTTTSKADMVNELKITMENGDLSYPDIPVLIDELRSFQKEKTPAGNIKYKHPEGKHDDSCDSLMLAVALSKRAGLGTIDDEELTGIMHDDPTQDVGGPEDLFDLSSGGGGGFGAV